MAGCVDQVHLVLFTVERGIEHTYRLRFDGDTLLAL